MKQNRKLITGAIFTAVMALFAFAACNKKVDDSGLDPTNNNPSGEGKATVNFHLTDGPADYDAVYIDIQQVEVTMEGEAAVTLAPVRPGVYNLLEFRNGLDTLLVNGAVLPPGKVGQIRLILGSNNSVVVDGQSYDMKTPSAQESGLKLNLQEEFKAGGAYDVWVDFDAGKSIVETGNGKFILKPVVRAYTSLTDGRIKGYVQPVAAGVTVYATNGVETYSAIPQPDGYYQFVGLPEGNYDVTFDAAVVTFIDVTVNDVNVTYGQTIDLGTTTLVQ